MLITLNENNFNAVVSHQCLCDIGTLWGDVEGMEVIKYTQVNPLSPNIKIQILVTGLYTLSYSISWENLLQDQNNFAMLIFQFILITLSLVYTLIL